MKTNRRDFIKVAGVASAGMITGGINSCNKEEMPLAYIKKNAEKPHKQIFNMSGYAAPPLETVRIGFIGLGHRRSKNIGRFRDASSERIWQR
ncbi:hypothetical protein ES705_20438 [subsurface metagenome]